MTNSVNSFLMRFMDKAAKQIEEHPLLMSNAVIPVLAIGALLTLRQLFMRGNLWNNTRLTPARISTRRRSSSLNNIFVDESFSDYPEEEHIIPNVQEDNNSSLDQRHSETESSIELVSEQSEESTSSSQSIDETLEEQEEVSANDNFSENLEEVNESALEEISGEETELGGLFALANHSPTLDKEMIKQTMAEELTWARKMPQDEIGEAKNWIRLDGADWVREDGSPILEKSSDATIKGHPLRCQVSHISKDSINERSRHYVGTLNLSNEELPVFAVFDGDGSVLPVNFAARNFQDILSSELMKEDNSTVGTWNALMQASLRLKRYFLNMPEKSFSKTSVAFAMIRGKYIWIVSMGDVRMLLDFEEKAIPLISFDPDRKASALVNGVKIQLQEDPTSLLGMQPRITRIPIQEVRLGSRLVIFSEGVAGCNLNRNRVAMTIDLNPIAPKSIRNLLASL